MTDGAPPHVPPPPPSTGVVKATKVEPATKNQRVPLHKPPAELNSRKRAQALAAEPQKVRSWQQPSAPPPPPAVQVAVLYQLEGTTSTLTLTRKSATIQSRPVVAMVDPGLVPPIGHKINVEGKPTFQVMDVQHSVGKRPAAIVVLRPLRPME